MDVKQPEATFVNLKTRGYLVYPNHNFFKLISAIEEGYVKHCTDPDVFNKTIDHVLEEYGDLLTFPCSNRKTEILTNIYYITMRMKNYFISKQRIKKENLQEKKLSKLVTT